jgi:cell division protein FtsW
MKGTTATLIAIVFLLAILGVVMVASTSMVWADDISGCGNFNRHLLWIFLALTGMLLMMRVDYHLLARHSPWILAATALLLMAVLVPGIGVKINGARRWLRFGGFSVQPSEIAKFALILFVAAWLVRVPGGARSFRWGFLPVLGVAGFVAGLIVIEPDLGTALLLLIVGTTLGILAGFRMLHIAPLVLPMIPFFYLFVWNVPWRRDRLLAFMDPWKYYDNAGYQLCQGLIALGSGGLAGVGPGQSHAKLTGFLPEAIHDFVFAIFGEEFGFAGALIVLGLFVAFVWYGIKVAMHARDVLGFLLASGVTLAIGLQALINIAVVTGSIPTKGIALPFVSYGGSSLFCLMCLVGVLLNVSRQAEMAEAAAAPAAPTEPVSAPETQPALSQGGAS